MIMKMSGDYATTVAAVAPVLWLVGAVEHHQVAKRLVSRWQEATEQIERDVAELGGESTGVRTGGRVAHSWKRLRESALLAGLALLWGTVSACLLLTTIMALRWLAAGDTDPQPIVAAFCFYSIAIGGLVISLTPILLATLRALTLAGRIWTAGGAAREHR